MSLLAGFWVRWGRYWLPVVAWMGLIFLVSSRPKADMFHHPDGNLDWILKKLAHLAEYAILTLLVWRAVSGGTGERTKRWVPWVIPAICIAYAASDEYHQSFVPGRRSSAGDVLIDTFGILLALGGMSALLWWRAKHPSRFRVYAWLDGFLDGFPPLRAVSHHNPPE
jgi:VanZ family protein